MKRSLVPAFVMLLAGTITCIIGVVYHYSLLKLLTTLLIVLLSFYILGSIFKWLLDRLIPLKKDKEEPENGEENSEDAAKEQNDTDDRNVSGEQDR